MAEWLRYPTHIHKIVCSNLGAIRHRITLDKLLTAICLGSPVPIAHWLRVTYSYTLVVSMLLARMYGKLKRLSEENSELGRPSVPEL